MKKIIIKIVFVAVVVLIISVMFYFYSNKYKLPPSANTEEIIMTIGDREGSFLMQKINTDSVEGAWYRIYPVAREGDRGEMRTLHIGDDIGYFCEGVSEKLIKIDSVKQVATFLKMTNQPPLGGCPI